VVTCRLRYRLTFLAERGPLQPGATPWNPQ